MRCATCGGPSTVASIPLSGYEVLRKSFGQHSGIGGRAYLCSWDCLQEWVLVNHPAPVAQAVEKERG